jgi:FKBP-type peptidyl-prolyl cis-trans isomerase
MSINLQGMMGAGHVWHSHSSMRHFRFSLFLIPILLMACGTDPNEQPLPSPHELKEPLVKANQHLVRTESEDIATYMLRHGLEMKETGSGLRYAIDGNGKGLPAKQGKVVRLNYTLKLLNGTTCYSSKERGIMEFLVGRGGVESGLEEAILLMREGDRGRFILPSHLAHGLPGDGDCIPAKAVVVYDLQLIAVLAPEN